MVEADVSPGDIDPDMHAALQIIMEELIDDVTLGLCFEIHRSCKIGSFFLEGGDESLDSEYAIVERHGVDVLGQVASKKSYECVCPNCQRHLAASRFAPHLEKCMGMGRNSSRIASRRIANNQKHGSDESGQDDENDNDWNYAPESKRLRKMKKDKMSNSPRNRRFAKLRNNNYRKLRNGTSGDHPNAAAAATAPTSADLSGACLQDSQEQLNYETMSLEERKALLLTKCGVISEITKKMCTRSTKCAQHTDEQRRLVRQQLLRQSRTHDLEDIHIDIDTYDDAESQSLRESLQWEASSNSSSNSTSSSLKQQQQQQRTTTTLTTAASSSSAPTSTGTSTNPINKSSSSSTTSSANSKSSKSKKSKSLKSVKSAKTSSVSSTNKSNGSGGGGGSISSGGGGGGGSSKNTAMATVSLFDLHE